MAVAPVLYTARFQGPTLLEQGQISVLTCPVYRDGVAVTVTSATVTVWNQNNTVIVNAAAATISSGVPNYSIASATVAGETPSDGWRIEWTCTIAALVTVFRDIASLVYRRLFPVITYSDLTGLHADLSRRKPADYLQDKTDECWYQIEAHLVNTGLRPWLNMDPRSLRAWHLFLTLEAVFRDLASGGVDSPEWAYAELYARKASDALAGMTFPQAVASTGEAQDSQRRRAAARPTFLAGRA